MPSDRKENQYGTPEPTPDVDRPDLNGQRRGLNELNLGSNTDHNNRERLLQRFLRGLSQFLAGMYTGESCAGTPHGKRKPESASRRHNNTDQQEHKMAGAKKKSSRPK